MSPSFFSFTQQFSVPSLHIVLVQVEFVQNSINSPYVSSKVPKLKLVSKELSHVLAIAAFFRDWAPRTLTGGA